MSPPGVGRPVFPSFRRVLVGESRRTRRSLRWAFLAVGVFALAFVGYAVDVFGVSGGVVFVPGDAAAVGLVAAAWLGYARDGLVAAWAVGVAAMLGSHADHAFLGLSGRSLAEQAAYFVQLDGLFVLTLVGVVVGSLAFPVGRALRRAVEEATGRGTAGAD